MPSKLHFTSLLVLLPLVFPLLNGCQLMDVAPTVTDSGEPAPDAGMSEPEPDGGSLPDPDGGSMPVLACEAPYRSVTPERCTAVWACAPDADPSRRADTFELQCSLIASDWSCTCYDRSSGVRVDLGSFVTSDGCGPTGQDTTDLARAYCGFDL